MARSQLPFTANELLTVLNLRAAPARRCCCCCQSLIFWYLGRKLLAFIALEYIWRWIRYCWYARAHVLVIEYANRTRWLNERATAGRRANKTCRSINMPWHGLATAWPAFDSICPCVCVCVCSNIWIARNTIISNISIFVFLNTAIFCWFSARPISDLKNERKKAR